VREKYELSSSLSLGENMIYMSRANSKHVKHEDEEK